MMGGGFGGCTISLIQEVDERDISIIRQAYLKKFGLLPDYFTVHPAQDWFIMADALELTLSYKRESPEHGFFGHCHCQSYFYG